MNTKIEDSIIGAIRLIADDAVANASYDKTVKGQIVKCKDKATGLYTIRYKDIEQDAYAINPSIKYVKDQSVFITIPKNDGSAIKTILGPVDHIVTTIDQQKDTSQLYNAKGPNLLSGTLDYDFSSYKSESKIVYSNSKTKNSIGLNDSIRKYITSGNSLVLKMNVQTTLDPAQRTAGRYGVIFNMIFSDEGTSKKIKKSYQINQMDVVGNPYGLDRITAVSHLEIVDGKNFQEISSIEVFCQNFPVQDDTKAEEIKDVHITQISLQGAATLGEEQLNGYSMEIDYSTNGDTFLKGEVTEILLKGIMKLKGVPINKDVKYYWFRQNGTVFQGGKSYSSIGGNGWECLNTINNGKYVGVSDNYIYFTTNQDNQHYKDYKLSPTSRKKEKKRPITVLDKTSKTIKIKCVGVYNKTTEAVGTITIYNDNINNDLIYITSSDGDKKDYYYNNGSPELTCHVKNSEGKDLVFRENDDGYYTWKENLQNDWRFIWSVEDSDGNRLLEESAAGALSDFYRKKEAYLNAKKTLNKTEKVNQEKYKKTEEYKTAVREYEKVKDIEIIDHNIYHHVDIGQIKNSAKIICGVESKKKTDDTYTYIGTASVNLYNHMNSTGEYILSLVNGSQVFQYDADGRSPSLVERVEKDRPSQPLSLNFILSDNKGEQISYEKILKNGVIYWCVPKNNTLLITEGVNSQEALSYITLLGTVRALAADDTYYIYENLQSLSYSIVDTFDAKKTNNDIRLYIVYKDLVFDVYTNFVFPKSGDPGTNGTPYFAKIWPVDKNKNLLTTDRVYIKWNEASQNNYDFYTDTGQTVKELGFRLYNNASDNTPIVSTASKWMCPIKKGSNSYFKIEMGKIKFSNSRRQDLEDIEKTPRPVNIIRAQYGKEQEMKYYAELPLNYVSIKSTTDDYRIKIREKTGFSYVIYDNDGTHPQYDSSKPFEIIIEKRVTKGSSAYYIEEQPSNYSFSWKTTGYLSIVDQNNKTNIAEVKPFSNFNGQALHSAIRVTISGVGFIYIPVYFSLNRYGFKSLNDWDGNSIELKDDAGVILTPQIGAGKKHNDNTFSGVLMGSMKEGNTENTGILGFHHGARTIFLDSDTGKAEFGKNNSGKIIIDPSIKINEKDAGILRSNDYDITRFPSEVITVQENGSTYNAINYDLKVNNSSVTTGGMIIDLSTPQIGFGNKKFYVTKDGALHSETGDIGGWNITASSLRSTYDAGNNKIGGVILSSNASSPTNKAIRVTNGDKNIFYVNYKGDLHSEAGDIGGWNITSTSLISNNTSVGMSSIRENSNSKAFFANGNNFYVTHDGYLRSQSGKIANWNISSSALTDGHTGMGSTIAPLTDFGLNGNDTLNLWSGNGSALTFGVSANGRLLSRYGTIGGWNISSSSLSAGDQNSSTGGISLSANGSISGKNTSYSWAINQDGSAAFTNIDASGGKIGTWNISSGAIVGQGNQVSLKNDGTIVANAGSIGGVTISNDGLRTNNWYILSNGKASFTDVIGLSGSLGGGTLTGGNYSGGDYSGCKIDPQSNYTSDGQTTLQQWVGDLVNASTGSFGTLIASTFTIGGVQVAWRDVELLHDISINFETKTYGWTRYNLRLLTNAPSPTSRN